MSESRRRRFLAVLVVVNLHILRNHPVLSEVYAVAWIFVTAMVILDYLHTMYRGIVLVRGVYLVSWLSAGIVGLLSSTYFISLSGSLFGLARLWFALPVYIALMAYTRDEQDLVVYSRWAVLVFTFAVLTIPLQVATGPISWFHDNTLRGEFARYPSLLGGLNAAGGAVAMYLVLAQQWRGLVGWVLIVVMSVSVALDLSKSGIASIGIGLLIIGYLNRKDLKNFVFGGLALTFATVSLLRVLPSAQSRLETTLVSFGLSSGSGFRNSDATVAESALDRLTALPMENLRAWWDLGIDGVESAVAVMFGGGYGMASTALVPARDSLAPMAHNQYVELVTVFGVVGTGMFAFVLIGAAYALAREKGSALTRDSRRVYLLVYVVFLGRLLFANGALYHPAPATVLYLCLFAAGLSSSQGRVASVRARWSTGLPATGPRAT